MKYYIALVGFLIICSFAYSQSVQKDSTKKQKATINARAYYLLPKAKNSLPVSVDDSIVTNPYMVPKPKGVKE